MFKEVTHLNGSTPVNSWIQGKSFFVMRASRHVSSATLRTCDVTSCRDCSGSTQTSTQAHSWSAIREPEHQHTTGARSAALLINSYRWKTQGANYDEHTAACCARGANSCPRFLKWRAHSRCATHLGQIWKMEINQAFILNSFSLIIRTSIIFVFDVGEEA